MQFFRVNHIYFLILPDYGRNCFLLSIVFQLFLLIFVRQPSPEGATIPCKDRTMPPLSLIRHMIQCKSGNCIVSRNSTERKCAKSRSLNSQVLFVFCGTIQHLDKKNKATLQDALKTTLHIATEKAELPQIFRGLCCSGNCYILTK